jgi:hypothetical protein
MTVIERIRVEDGFVIEKESFIDPFELWRGKEPTRIRIGDEEMTVVDSGPGWVDVERGAEEDTA